MSYRELRNFTETMRALGYHRPISVENFRTPNFELVADILYWLVHRYDPSVELSADISRENLRVDFLKNVSQILATKAQLKLNVKELYKADGYAVRELLKLSSLLYSAMRTEEEEPVPAEAATAATKLEEMKEARAVARDVVETGSKLYGLLEKEADLRKSRDKAIQFLEQMSSNLESDEGHQFIEKTIKQQINSIMDNIQNMQKMCSDLETDKKTLSGKIDKRRNELERQEKRLKSLKAVRPAFMDELEVLEKQLKVIYQNYLEKYRNLSYMEAELETYRQIDQEKKEEADRALKKLQAKLKSHEQSLLRGDSSDRPESEQEEGGLDDDQEEKVKAPPKPGAAAKLRRPGAADQHGRQLSSEQGKPMQKTQAQPKDDEDDSESESQEDSDQSDDEDLQPNRGSPTKESPVKSQPQKQGGAPPEKRPPPKQEQRPDSAGDSDDDDEYF